MRNKSITTIVGLGLVTAIFMAVMSMFYLQQIPTQADIERLEGDLRQEHMLALSSAAPLDMSILRPKESGDRTGLSIVCTLRPDLRKRTQTVDLYLARIADSVLNHPDWRGRIGYVKVSHAAPLDRHLTRFADNRADKKP